MGRKPEEAGRADRPQCRFDSCKEEKEKEIAAVQWESSSQSCHQKSHISPRSGSVLPSHWLRVARGKCDLSVNKVLDSDLGLVVNYPPHSRRS